MKTIYQSKTFWVAVLTFIVGGVVALQTNFPTVGWLVMAKAILDIVLRYLTKEEVK